MSDWVVLGEWNIDDGYILNGAGEKIVDFIAMRAVETVIS